MSDLRCGDCLEVMRALPSGSVDAIVTDPPAGIGFMGKAWDKPGVLGVSGGRAMPATMANRNPMCRACGKHQRGKPPRPVCQCAEPAFDTQAGRARERTLFIEFLAERMAEARRVSKPGAYALVWALPRTSHWTALALEDAGWVIRDRVAHLFGQGFPKAKSCLKPAVEDWWLAWNPARKVTPLNIDGCRIETEQDRPLIVRDRRGVNAVYGEGLCGSRHMGGTSLGRWPANVLLTCCWEDPHAEGCPVAELDRQSGELASGKAGPDGHKRNAREPGGIYGNGDGLWIKAGPAGRLYGDSGGASRFFYVAKASRKDRGEGNTHPTVKPHELMRWLCRLITPEGGTVLDPFMGSGSTGKAALVEGFGFIGIEKNPGYFAVASDRIASVERSQAERLCFDRTGS